MFIFNDHSTVRIQTPAKLNLFLEVVGKRSDGFHDIETLITAINLYDELTMQLTEDGGIALSCRWTYGRQAQSSESSAAEQTSLGRVFCPLPEMTSNLVFRAVKRLQEESGCTQGASIQLVKRIPAEAGLGGASADAAGAMLAANQLWNLGWSRQRLAELGGELGSDIPFFFQTGAAICRGRGERIKRIPIRPMHFVLLKPPVGLSTASVYKACRPGTPAISVEPLAEALKQGPMDRVADLLFNRLESPSEELTPWIGRARNALAETGCLAARMTGSGTCCFGLYRSAKHARRAAAQLRHRNLGGVCAAANCAGHANHIEGVA